MTPQSGIGTFLITSFIVSFPFSHQAAVVTTLNKQPVWVGGKLYENGQAVLTIKSDAHGIAASAADALP